VLQRLGEQSSLSHKDCLTVFTATTFLAGCLMTALHAPVQPNAFFQFPPMVVLQDSTTCPCFCLYSPFLWLRQLGCHDRRRSTGGGSPKQVPHGPQ
jgi:hypothetical protein